VAFSGVVDGEVVLAKVLEESLDAWYDFSDGCYIVALVLEIAFRGTDLRSSA